MASIALKKRTRSRSRMILLNPQGASKIFRKIATTASNRTIAKIQVEAGVVTRTYSRVVMYHRRVLHPQQAKRRLPDLVGFFGQ
jgi:hypothetical protein